MPARKVNLTDRYDKFVESQLRTGRFRNASEVMRAGLHLLEKQTREEREKLLVLRKLARKAWGDLDRGEGIAFSSETELAAFIRKLGARSIRRANRRSSK